LLKPRAALRARDWARFARTPLRFLALMGSVAPMLAMAQNQPLLIDPELPDDFDRGRNVSVVDQPRPGYDPIGIRLGALRVFPRVELSAGASDNVYFRPTNRVSDVYLAVAPSVRVAGDFSSLTVNLRAEAELRRFLDETLRNENTWSIQPGARLNIADEFRLFVDLRAARRVETVFSGEVDSDIAVLSRYTNLYGRLRGQYEAGQARATLAIDHTIFDFSPVELASGVVRSQAERDRRITRVTAQGEYAFSPSMSAFAQVNYGNTTYKRPLAGGQPNRDSAGWRISAGVNLDLSQLLRGSVGVGYTWRNYDAPIYEDIDGFSVETKLEYFPTQLTTFTLNLRRTLLDSNLGSSQTFFDNRASLRVDHALLRNLILTAEGQYGVQDYFGSDVKAKIFSVFGGVDYALSRSISLNAFLRFRNRERSTLGLDTQYREFQGAIGLILRR
jgi:hypothetical protein